MLICRRLRVDHVVRVATDLAHHLLLFPFELGHRLLDDLLHELAGFDARSHFFADPSVILQVTDQLSDS